MKYRIVKRKALYRSEFGHYWARDCWDVEERFLYFFWLPKKGFWEEDVANEYYEALAQLSK